jgi:hypothetical protein
MKITIELPGCLWAELQAHAASQGTNPDAVTASALTEVLVTSATSPSRMFKLRRATFAGHGLSAEARSVMDGWETSNTLARAAPRASGSADGPAGP